MHTMPDTQTFHHTQDAAELFTAALKHRIRAVEHWKISGLPYPLVSHYHGRY